MRRLQGLYPDKRGALLPVLHLAQDTFGYISLEVEEYVAGLFELYPAHVHEVVTFYTMFFQKPKGRHVVSVCHNISCYLMERDPHGLLEGMIIAARAIGSHLGFVYIRGEYVQPWRVLDGAVREAYAAGLLGKNIQGSGTDFDVVLHRGAGAYICGEETGLISSLEGKKGWPKIKPPISAVKEA